MIECINEEGEKLPIDRVRKIHNISADKVRNIETKASRILRHPSHSHELKDYLEITDKH